MRMKKFLIKPMHIIIAVILVAIVVGGGVYAYQQWNSPYKDLPAAERKHRERVDTFEGCLQKAEDKAAHEACLLKYPDV
jgi:hypothetical protein